MRGFREVPDTLIGIAVYAVVLAAVFTDGKIYENTHFKKIFLLAAAFVVLLPIVLIPVMEFSSREWPDRLFRWHLVACGWILVFSLVMLVMHWLRLRIP